MADADEEVQNRSSAMKRGNASIPMAMLRVQLYAQETTRLDSSVQGTPGPHLHCRRTI